jgi:hypothetical protein
VLQVRGPVGNKGERFADRLREVGKTEGDSETGFWEIRENVHLKLYSGAGADIVMESITLTDVPDRWPSNVGHRSRPHEGAHRPNIIS